MEQPNHLKILSAVLHLLQPLEAESRRRVLETVLTFFADGVPRQTMSASTWDAVDAGKIAISKSPLPFSVKTDISPKDFLAMKSPKSDVERVACLGFYLTQYRGLPYFKTADLSVLNTEAAQPKFSNAAQAVANANKNGYLAPATKGNKQISAQGEQFVVALPDRDAAKAAMANRPKRSRARAKLNHMKRSGVILAEAKPSAKKMPPRKGAVPDAGHKTRNL